MEDEPLLFEVSSDQDDRAKLLNDLLIIGFDERELAERSERAGLVLGLAHAVLVTRVLPEVHREAVSQTERLHRAIKEMRLGARKALPFVNSNEGLLVGICPLDIGTDTDMVRECVETALSHANIARETIYAAIGRVEARLSGISSSYRQAKVALDVAQLNFDQVSKEVRQLVYCLL